MEMLPLVSCVMSHFEKENKLSSEHLNNWRMLVHLNGIRQVDILKFISVHGPKMDTLDGVTPRIPVNVRCSIFNDIPPIP